MQNKKNIYIIGGVILVVIVIVLMFVVKPTVQDRTVVTDTLERVDNVEMEISFAFPSGEGALTSIESTPEQLGGGSLLHMYLLMQNSAYIEFQNENPEGADVPPGISILIFDLTEEDKLAEATASTTYDKIRLWANSNNGYSNIGLAKGDIDEIKIDGVPAVHYLTDGLYLQEMYLARAGGKIYLFAGQYIEEGDYMNQTYKTIIDSVRFE